MNTFLRPLACRSPRLPVMRRLVIRLGLVALLTATTTTPIAPAARAAASSPAAGSAAVADSSTGAGASFAPALSADRQRVAFVSLAPNLTAVPVQGLFLDLYLRPLDSGNTTLLSVNAAGNGGGNGHSLLPALSSNGLVVAFESEASNLALPGHDNNDVSDILVRDVVTGVTRLASENAAGTGSGNGRSRDPLISADGRAVVFVSAASDLVTNDFNGTDDVFLRDLVTGVTILISVNAAGTGSANGRSEAASISADGRTVAFVSHGTDLVAGVTNTLGEVYVRRLTEGGGTTVWAGTRHLAATSPPFAGAYRSSQPRLTPDGRFLVFQTLGGALVRWDLTRPTNTIVTDFPAIPPAVHSFRDVFEDNPRFRPLATPPAEEPARLSDDGRFALISLVATNTGPETLRRVDFESFESSVQASESGPGLVVVTNQVPTEEIVLAAPPGTPVARRSIDHFDCSADATRVLFTGILTNLDPAAVNGSRQLFLRDLIAARTWLISTNRLGGAGRDLGGATPALSHDGQVAVYETTDLLVDGDVNDASDVFARNVDTGATRLISARAPERPSRVLSGASHVRPQGLSADGRWLAFMSLDRPDADRTGPPNHVVWLRDLAAGTNVLLQPAGYYYSRDAVLSGDGRYVAYLRSEPRPPLFTGPSVIRLDRQTGLSLEIPTRIDDIVSGTGGRLPNFALSRDGRFLAHVEPQNSGLEVTDTLVGTHLLISTQPDGVSRANGFHWDPQFSANGRWVTFLSTSTQLTTNGRPGLHLHHRLRGLTWWLTDSVGQTGLTNGSGLSGDSHWITYARSNQVFIRHLGSDDDVGSESLLAENASHPVISDDGQRIAYATPVDGTRWPDIVLLDRATARTTLVSHSRTGPAGGNGPSSTPVLSGDGRFVVFVSRAGDLVDGDGNGQADVFVRDTLLGTTLLVSRSLGGPGGVSGNGPSARPILGGDGRTLVFHSFASDLVDGDFNARRDVLVLHLGAEDTDGDGLDDDWERTYFDTLERDGSGDFDQDGVSDRAEFLAGTSPIDDVAFLRVLTVSPASTGGAGVTILWSAVPGRSYRVQYKADPAAGDWQELPGLVTATAGTASAFDAGASGSKRFYRVERVP